MEAVYRITGPSFTRYDVARQGEKIAEAQEASLAANKPTTAAATISTVKTPVAAPCGPRQRRLLYLHLLFARTPTAPGAGQDKPETMMSRARTRPVPRPGTGQAGCRGIGKDSLKQAISTTGLRCPRTPARVGGRAITQPCAGPPGKELAPRRAISACPALCVAASLRKGGPPLSHQTRSSRLCKTNLLQQVSVYQTVNSFTGRPSCGVAAR